MLTWLFDQLAADYSFFNVFRYLTFRAICGVVTAFVIFFVFGAKMIEKLKQHQIGQTVRQDGPPTHFAKNGTPTMGGVLILIAVSVSTFLWADLTNRYTWVALFTIISFGLIGWFDDYRKLINKNSHGIGAKTKFILQSFSAIVIALFLFYTATQPEETVLIVPLFKDVMIPLGGFFIVLAYLVIVGASNAVNLTDGLDGLAIMLCVMVASALGVFAYVSGNANFSDYLGVPYIDGSGETLIFCAALAGAGLGFLWFNSYPAQVFMGDVGALSLGAALGVVAVIVRQEIVLLVMSGIFVIETVSVILQVIVYKRTGRRVFKMAPLHHHFEMSGWPEQKVVVRFWIVGLLFMLIGLATLKIR